MSIKQSSVTVTSFWNFLDKSKQEYIEPEMGILDSPKLGFFF